MQHVPAAHFGDRRDHLHVQQSAGAALVSGDLHVTRTKQGIFSIELGRRLGVTQATA